MKIISVDQRSQEWFDVRRGIPSASEFDKIITTKGDPSKQAQKYLYKLAGEKVSGISEETYQNSAMLLGIEREEEARQLYTFVTGNEVKQVGFCVTEGEFVVGCSPDGLVGDDGGLEIKCPNVATHVGYLIDNVLPSDYFQQVQGSLFVTGRKWWDFMSYSVGIRPFIIRVTPDEKFKKSLRIELEIFCTELKKIINKIGG